jgi:hypothetical protein
MNGPSPTGGSTSRLPRTCTLSTMARLSTQSTPLTSTPSPISRLALPRVSDWLRASRVSRLVTLVSAPGLGLCRLNQVDP